MRSCCSYPLAAPLAVAPDMEATSAVDEDYETTNSEGVAVIPLPNWESGREQTVAVPPPKETQLLETSFKVHGLAEDETRVVALKEEPTNRHLTVSKLGAGSGIVTSSPTGISCGATCTAEFKEGTEVLLTAEADKGSTFSGWSGACSGTGTCKVTMSEPREVTATFAPEQHQLTVVRKGAGSDGVTSSPPGISCGETCSASFDHGTVVTLTEVVKSGTVFLDWAGCDSEFEGKCIVTMSEAKSVTALFGHEKPVLTLTKAGTGAGTVKSKPAAITCGSVCSEAKAALYKGALVKLTATPAKGSTFAEWSGCDAVVAGECEVTMEEAKSVSATFSGSTATIVNPQALTLTKTGSGSGSVTGSGIACSGFCTSTVAIYSGPPKAKVVTVTAKPVPGSELTWSGCDSEPEPLKCKVTMSKAKEVTATFEE